MVSRCYATKNIRCENEMVFFEVKHVNLNVTLLTTHEVRIYSLGFILWMQGSYFLFDKCQILQFQAAWKRCRRPRTSARRPRTPARRPRTPAGRSRTLAGRPWTRAFVSQLVNEASQSNFNWLNKSDSINPRLAWLFLWHDWRGRIQTAFDSSINFIEMTPTLLTLGHQSLDRSSKSKYFTNCNIWHYSAQ